MKTTFIIIIFLTISLAFDYCQYEYGTENSVHWAPQPYHVLQTGTSIPRSVDVTIKFKQKFTREPQIGLSNNLLDWQNGSPSGYIISIVSQSLEQFIIRYTAVSNRQLYGLFNYYFAIFDPRIRIQWFETTELGAIMKGDGPRQTSLQIAVKDFKDPPVAVAFLTGVKFQTGNYVIFSKITAKTNKFITIEIKTWHTSTIQMVKFCIVTGTDEAIWVSDYTGFKIPNGQHPWRLINSPIDRPIASSVDVVRFFTTGDRVQVIGFTGYDAEETRNQRIYIRNFQLVNNKATSEIGVWWDSVLYQLQYQVLIYKRDNSLKVFNDNCSEIFDECSFQGDSLTLCDKITSLPQLGWAKPVRSFTVPNGRVVRLFNEEQFKGQVVTYTENQDCIEEIDYQFNQVLLTFD